MDRYQTPLWLPLAVLFAIGLVAFVIPSWTLAIIDLGKSNGISESWAGFAGAIISAFLTIAATIAGAIVAWLAIRSQNRINILAREEERIERELPGLIEASRFLSGLALAFSGYVSGKGALATLSAWNFNDTTTAFLGDVKKWIPNSSDAVQRRLAVNLNAIWVAATIIRTGEEAAQRSLDVAQAEQTPPDRRYEAIQRWKSISNDVREQQSFMSQPVGYILAMNVELADRVKRLEARRVDCRRQIDSFFRGDT